MSQTIDLPEIDIGADPLEAVRMPVISVIVLVTERPEPLPELYTEFAASLRSLGEPFEFVFVVDARWRHLAETLVDQVRHGEPVRVLEVGQPVGEATLLKAAAEHCGGSMILTLPAYRRVEAAALPRLIKRLRAGADVAVARRWPRRDPWLNRVQHRIMHALVRRAIGDGLNDIGCGVRAIRRDVLRELPLYGDFSRFLPVIARREGFIVEEVTTPQHAADLNRRVYAPGQYLRRIIDLVAIYFLVRFREKPLRFFGLVGSMLAGVGVLIFSGIVAQRLGGRPMADRPLLLVSVLLLVLGLQSLALGLVGEIIVHVSARSGLRYRLGRATER